MSDIETAKSELSFSCFSQFRCFVNLLFADISYVCLVDSRCLEFLSLETSIKRFSWDNVCYRLWSLKGMSYERESVFIRRPHKEYHFAACDERTYGLTILITLQCKLRRYRNSSRIKNSYLWVFQSSWFWWKLNRSYFADEAVWKASLGCLVINGLVKLIATIAYSFGLIYVTVL